MPFGQYILDDENRALLARSAREWSQWFEEASRTGRRVVGLDEFIDDGEIVRVSTVFLGLDHRFGQDDGAPILFETMVFGGQLEGEMWRYETWEQAKLGHQRVCEELKLERPTKPKELEPMRVVRFRRK